MRIPYDQDASGNWYDQHGNMMTDEEFNDFLETADGEPLEIYVKRSEWLASQAAKANNTPANGWGYGWY